MDLFYVFVLAVLSCLCHAAFWSPARKWLLGSPVSNVLVHLSLSHMVSWVRSGP